MESKILFDLALILFTTKVFGLMTRKLHLPQVVGALLVGVILGPALLGIIETNDIIGTIAEFGVILILFEAGLGTDLGKLRKSVVPLLLISALGVAASLAGGFILAYSFGLGLTESIFVGVILISSSIGITVEVLNEMDKLNSKTGTAILGVAVVEDIFVIIIFSVVIGIGGGGVSVASIGSTLLTIALFLFFAAGFGFVVFKTFEYLEKKCGISRGVSVFAIAFCFFMAFAADSFGLADIIGAYIAGLVLSNIKAEKYIEEKSSVLSFMFFSPVFFASIGLNVSFADLNMGNMWFLVLFVITAVATKLLGCALGAKIFKYSNREATQVGAGMVARCEFPVVAATIGLSMGLVDMGLFSIVMIMVIATALIAPIILKLAFCS